MRTTNKADLVKKLESNCPDVLTELPQIPTSTSSAYIIDGMAMVQSLNKNHFRTFEDLAEVVQKRTVRLLSNPSLELSCVIIVFDRYDNGSSIKATERERRGSSALLPTYQIQGSRQVPNCRKFLKGVGNKASLANYISLYILEHATEYIPNEKSIIILAGGFSEAMLVKEATPSGVSSIERLYSNQEEADTRMILYASILSRDHERIIIQCDDTDVLVLLVYYFSRGHLTDHVYMYAGHSGKERYIPVNRIANELGQTVCECLPAANALTGCDTTCSMNRIGMKTAYSKQLKKVDTLSNLNTFHEDDLEDSVAVARSYALLLYGKKGSDMDILDELRYIMATTTYKSASMLPPTEDAFKQHVLRAKYQTRIRCNSHMPNKEVIEPDGHGWSACDDEGIT